MGRPFFFVFTTKAGQEQRLALQPLTLGKVIINSQLLQALGVSEALATANPLAEALRLGEEHRHDILRLIAINTLERAHHALDEARVQARLDSLEALTTEDVATLLVAILELDHSDAIIRESGIAHDLDLKARIHEHKAQEGHTISLGGRTLYGSLLDQASERYGWTIDYILWGAPYTTLKLMLADAPTSLHLSQDEAEAIGYRHKGNVINADDPASLEAMRALLD